MRQVKRSARRRAQPTTIEYFVTLSGPKGERTFGPARDMEMCLKLVRRYAAADDAVEVHKYKFEHCLGEKTVIKQEKIDLTTEHVWAT